METPNTLHDFVQFNTRIDGQSNNFETSFYAEIENLFAAHLKLPQDSHMESLGVNLYKLKIGTKVTIGPSEWAMNFCEEKNLEMGTEYGKTFEISDIEIEYCSKHPHRAIDTPFMIITIILRTAKWTYGEGAPWSGALEKLHRSLSQARSLENQLMVAFQ